MKYLSPGLLGPVLSWPAFSYLEVDISQEKTLHRSFAICGSMQDSKKSQHPIPVNLPWFYVKHRPFLRILSQYVEDLV